MRQNIGAASRSQSDSRLGGNSDDCAGKRPLKKLPPVRTTVRV
jgi:hypothetical protein